MSFNIFMALVLFILILLGIGVLTFLYYLYPNEYISEK
jgi:hypothetical protein